MMKSLLAANRSEKDSFRIPHSVQQSIPIRRIYTDGIWQVGQKYSKTWRFSDINYAASSLDDRRSIFRSYGAVLNSLPTDATAKITIINRRLNPVDFQRTMLMPECSDGLDYYRGEYNQIILDKAAESNNLVQEKYITLSIGLRKIEQTRAYFRRVDTNLSASFGRLDSGAYAISCADPRRFQKRDCLFQTVAVKIGQLHGLLVHAGYRRGIRSVLTVQKLFDHKLQPVIFIRMPRQRIQFIDRFDKTAGQQQRQRRGEQRKPRSFSVQSAPLLFQLL